LYRCEFTHRTTHLAAPVLAVVARTDRAALGTRQSPGEPGGHVQRHRTTEEPGGDRSGGRDRRAAHQGPRGTSCARRKSELTTRPFVRTLFFFLSCRCCTTCSSGPSDQARASPSSASPTLTIWTSACCPGSRGRYGTVHPKKTREPSSPLSSVLCCSRLSSSKIAFHPYRVEQLRAIIEQRLQLAGSRGLFRDDALSCVTRKVSSRSCYGEEK